MSSRQPVARHGCRFRVAAMAAVVATAFAGCSPRDEPTPTSSSSHSTPTTSVSSSPASPSVDPSSPQTMAERAVVEYVATIDAASADPSASLSELAAVARGSALAQWQQILTQQRVEGITQAGSVAVEDASAKTASTNGRWSVSACLDVTNVDLLDTSGKSVVKADRPPRVRYVYVVERDRGKFYVVEEKAVGAC